MHRRLEHIKEALVCVVEAQMCDLTQVDAKELGEVVDMIKDIDEAIYYATVTEAMKGREEKWDIETKKSDHHQMENDDGRWYYDSSRSAMKRMGQEKTHWEKPMGQEGHQGETPSWSEEEPKHKDEREGHSYVSRRMYMEARDMKKDKATQLRELERYMTELSQDITDMIAEASPEERQYMEKKIAALASKVGQMK